MKTNKKRSGKNIYCITADDRNHPVSDFSEKNVSLNFLTFKIVTFEF